MDARVVSGASTAYDSHPESSSRELFAEAGRAALDRAGLSPGDVDAVYVGNFMGGLIEDQGHMGPLLADVVGARAAETVRLESACASGGATFRQAALAGPSPGRDPMDGVPLGDVAIPQVSLPAVLSPHESSHLAVLGRVLYDYRREISCGVLCLQL